ADLIFFEGHHATFYFNGYWLRISYDSITRHRLPIITEMNCIYCQISLQVLHYTEKFGEVCSDMKISNFFAREKQQAWRICTENYQHVYFTDNLDNLSLYRQPALYLL